ncbi:hypothetical protein EST38_g917 [Candolleomyces aberdarensis]|uniref:VanZ-like domain-containing protein n=1 Tax=Candolleomyces aberdarensis TaxID=2316362 RepID=A0A4Q2E014_9AGAR|nr:hypothetical protein EST38_g917 [Candolleomyces aberdarensis]
MLGFLGFTNFSQSLPLNDKMLHFICFGIATAVFYWIVDVEEYVPEVSETVCLAVDITNNRSARRVWFWRNASLIFTSFTCFFCGGILSEIVQSLLPFKQFEILDIVANISGSSLGLLGSYHLEKYYRHRREINRLYRPLNPEYSEDEDEELSSAFLLPTVSPHLVPPKSGKGKTVRFADPDVWDEREEVFDVGEDESDDEENEATRTATSSSSKSSEPMENQSSGKTSEL